MDLVSWQFGGAGQLVGALIVTYIVRTVLLRMLPFDDRRPGHLLILHALSATLCATAAGLLKAALTIFNTSAIAVYLAAQICWFVFDIWRTSKSK